MSGKSKGMKIKCVLLEPANPRVLAIFDKNSIDYELLPVTQHNSILKLMSYLLKYRPGIFYLHFYGGGSPLILCARLFSAANIIFHDHNSLELVDPKKETSNPRALEYLEYLLATKRDYFSLFCAKLPGCFRIHKKFL